MRWEEHEEEREKRESGEEEDWKTRASKGSVIVEEAQGRKSRRNWEIIEK